MELPNFAKLQPVGGPNFNTLKPVTNQPNPVNQSLANLPGTQGNHQLPDPTYSQDPNSYVQRVVQQYAKAGQSIKQNITAPAEGMAQGESPLKTGARTALSGVNTVGDIAGASLAPITEAVSPIVKPLIDKLLTIPGAKNVAIEATKLANSHPTIAHTLNSIFNILTLGVGSAIEKPIIETAQTAGYLAKGVAEGSSMIAAEKSAAKQAEKSLSQATESATLTSREMTPTAYKEALAKGDVTPRTNFSPDKPTLPENLKPVVTKFPELLQSKDPIVNHGKVMDKITEIDKNVGEFLKTQNTTIWSPSRLKTTLSDALKGVDDISIPKSRLAEAKGKIVSNFVDSLPKNATMEDLWNARKSFDSKIQSAFTGAPTIQKEMQRSFRNAVQDFVASHTSEGSYKAAMKDMSDLFDLADTTEAKATVRKGRSKIVQIMKANPIKTKLALGGAAVAGAGVVGKAANIIK